MDHRKGGERQREHNVIEDRLFATAIGVDLEKVLPSESGVTARTFEFRRICPLISFKSPWTICSFPPTTEKMSM